ncbi:hypothetical protein [Ferruginibacter sp. SUN106]|uniref:hypothetical protein n=1 Tax=Ferruginibacter sp. SUN106 TaxID=2978348 RepID=UPI003D363323
MTRNIKYFLFSLLTVAAFLMLRHWLDRKREKIQDIDIVRADMYEGDSHLGTWAQKNGNVLVTFRLKRDGNFNYEVDEGTSKDTVRYAGKYLLLPASGKDGWDYVRLVAVSDKGDTIINHFIETTHATKRDVDVLSLKTDTTAAMLFYRVKQ